MKYTDSLKKNRDFQQVYHGGTSKSNRYLVMVMLRNGQEMNRLGISVSKKVGNSVVRHRITRLIREGYRLNEDSFISGLDLVIIARPAAKDISFHEVEGSLLYLGNRLHIIRKSEQEEEPADISQE